MKLEGDYLYPETPEGAIAFRGFEYEWLHPARNDWVGRLCLSVYQLHFPEDIRIPRTEARKSLEYKVDEPWCCPDVDAMLAVGSGVHLEGDSFGTFPLHKRAIYLINNADEFRELWAWLNGGKS